VEEITKRPRMEMRKEERHMDQDDPVRWNDSRDHDLFPPPPPASDSSVATVAVAYAIFPIFF
jgi:hypothetical protein